MPFSGNETNPLTREFDGVDTDGKDVFASPTLPSLFGVKNAHLVPPPTIRPALSPNVELSLTVVYIVLYGLIFLLVYVQLWMIWYYRHKRLSYQTVFLFLCLIWSGLRTTLFSFYFQNCILANNLPLLVYWLLYCFPVCLQFTILCLIALFFAQVLFKAKAKHEPCHYKRYLRIGVGFAIIVFLAANFACALVVKYHERHYNSQPLELLYVRVGINDTLFVICGAFLSILIYKIAKVPSCGLILENKGQTYCQSLVVAIVILLLYLSRAVYNLIAIVNASHPTMPGFGYDWINVSDQADLVTLDKGYAYLSYGIVLFVWEVLPTLIVVLYFRVKRPKIDKAFTEFTPNSHNSKSYFFDNPRRYDSDDDLSRSEASRSVYDGSFGHSANGNIPTSIQRSSLQGSPRFYPDGLQSGSFGSPSRILVSTSASIHSSSAS